MAKDVQVVSRVAGILSALSVCDSASLVEVSAACGLAVSTTSRLLDSLEREGFVERDYVSKKYCLGSRLLGFAAGVRPRKDIASVLHSVLEELSQQTGEDTGLAELQGSQAVIIDRVEGTHVLRIIDVINRPEPLYCGAFRKALLAFQSDAWIKDYIHRTEFIAYTEATIPNEAQLWKEIARIRRQGVAESFGERLSDASGAAAPIFDHAGNIRAVIQIAGPKTRINAETVDFYTSAVKSAGVAATRQLSGRAWSGRAIYQELASRETA